MALQMIPVIICSREDVASGAVKCLLQIPRLNPLKKGKTGSFLAENHQTEASVTVSGAVIYQRIKDRLLPNAKFAVIQEPFCPQRAGVVLLLVVVLVLILGPR